MVDANSIDWDSEEFDSVPKALRDLAKKQQKALDEQAAELSRLQTQAAERSVSDALAGHGFANPARVRSAILADGIDPSNPEAINTWVTENGADFARSGSQPPQATPDLSKDQEAYGKLDVPGATPAEAKGVADKVISQITKDTDPMEVYKMFIEAGA